MSFRVQIYRENEFGVSSPLDPQEVFAATPDEAAEKVCGTKVVEKKVEHGRLAAKVWEAGSEDADFRLFYRKF